MVMLRAEREDGWLILRLGPPPSPSNLPTLELCSCCTSCPEHVCDSRCELHAHSCFAILSLEVNRCSQFEMTYSILIVFRNDKKRTPLKCPFPFQILFSFSDLLTPESEDQMISKLCRSLITILFICIGCAGGWNHLKHLR